MDFSKQYSRVVDAAHRQQPSVVKEIISKVLTSKAREAVREQFPYVLKFTLDKAKKA